MIGYKQQQPSKHNYTYMRHELKMMMLMMMITARVMIVAALQDQLSITARMLIMVVVRRN